MEKERDTHIPIIALTAGALKEEQKKCMVIGMNGFLTKPIEPEKVKAVLMKHLTGKDISTEAIKNCRRSGRL